MIRRDGPVVLVGELDGHHLGHQLLVDAALGLGRGHRRPVEAVVLDADGDEPVLEGVDIRVRRLVGAGASAARVLSVPPQVHDHVELAEELAGRIVDRLAPSLVVMACPPEQRPDTAFPPVTAAIEACGVPVVQVPRVHADGGVVTSDRVRSLVLAGDVQRAGRLLGRSVSLRGPVVHGAQLGRTIGFPTANLQPPPRRVLPRRGVYAGAVVVDGERIGAAINIGTRPTVDGAERVLVEAHLLDFDRDIYDRPVVVELVHRLRDERRFDGLEALAAQLARDVEQTRARWRDAPTTSRHEEEGDDAPTA